MSHFTVLVVLPKEGLQRLKGREFEGKEEWQNAYDHQWYHPQLEQALEPYNENPENESDHCERVLEYNETASKVFSSYKKKQWDYLAQEFAEVKDQREKMHRISQVHDTNNGGFRKHTEDEIATLLEPFNELYGIMATEDFDMYNADHEEMFKALFCFSDEIVWSEQGDVEDVYYSNPYAKWDWWVVGGRWRDMGDNGVFTDLNVFLEEKEIPYWKEELGLKLYDIEKELGIDRENITKEEYDELITDYIASGNPIVRFYDTETKQPKEYYDKKDLLTMVKRKKESTWAMLFPEEGWIEAGEMGWFGISSLDMMNLGETEEAKQDQYALTDNYLKKYLDTHVGIVVDCHI